MAFFKNSILSFICVFFLSYVHGQELSWELDIEKGPAYETSGKDLLNKIIGAHDEYIIGLGFNMWFSKSTIYVFDGEQKLLRKGLVSINDKILKHSQSRNIYSQSGKTGIWSYEFDKKKRERQIVHYDLDANYINFVNPVVTHSWKSSSKIPIGRNAYLYVKSSPKRSQKIFLTTKGDGKIKLIRISNGEKAEFDYDFVANHGAEGYNIEEVLVNESGKVFVLRMKQVYGYKKMNRQELIDMKVFDYELVELDGANLKRSHIDLDGIGNEGGQISIDENGELIGCFSSQNPEKDGSTFQKVKLNNKETEFRSVLSTEIISDSLLRYVHPSDSALFKRRVKKAHLIPQKQLKVKNVITHSDQSSTVVLTQEFSDFHVKKVYESSYDQNESISQGKHVTKTEMVEDKTKYINLGNIYFLHYSKTNDLIWMKVIPHESRYRSPLNISGVFSTKLKNDEVFVLFNDDNGFNAENVTTDRNKTFSENFIIGYVVDKSGKCDRFMLKNTSKVFLYYPIQYPLPDDEFLFYENMVTHGSLDKIVLTRKVGE